MAYGERLRELRAERGLSLRQVEERGGPNKDTLSLIERGVHKPHPQTLGRLAKALDMSVANLQSGLEAAEHPLSQAPQPLAVPFMARPEVRDWLQEQGHMSRDEFRTYVEALDLDIDEDGWPRGLEQAIGELRHTRDRLIKDLKSPATRTTLVPKRSGLSTKDERIREALRPAKDVRELKWEIRHEYLLREQALIDYGRRLHQAGKTAGYLARGPAEYERRRILAQALSVAGAA